MPKQQRVDYWIIDTLMDTDLYKFTMLQAFYHEPLFNGVDAEWKLKCRNLGTRDLSVLICNFQKQLEHVCDLQFMFTELQYLENLPYLKKDFIEYLKLIRLDRKHFQIMKNGKAIDLTIKGPLIHVMLFEIYALAILSELNTQLLEGGLDYDEGRKRLAEKCNFLKSQDNIDGLMISDFSTRRRATKRWQYEVVDYLKNVIPTHFAGTSNVHLARELGITPIGTHAHEFFQAYQAVVRLEDAQRVALEAWVREYRGRLGTALTDCYSMDSFCRDFSYGGDPYFALLFSGLRHDSGCPIIWGEKAIALYDKLGVDPKTKTLVFSDGLNFQSMMDIYRVFQGRTQLGFGIGTNLSNDTGFEPLNIVIKMVRANNGRAVAKISDAPGKSMCEDLPYLQYLAGIHKIDPTSVLANK